MSSNNIASSRKASEAQNATNTLGQGATQSQSFQPQGQFVSQGQSFLPQGQNFQSQGQFISQAQFAPQTQFVQGGIQSSQFVQGGLQSSQFVSSPLLQGQSVSSQYVGTSVGAQTLRESIKGESRIEYIPYEKNVLEYEAVERVEYIPRTKVVQDVYAVEYITEYVPQVYQDRYIEYIPQERVTERIEYVPIERQLVHYPQEEVQAQTQFVSQVPTTQYVSQAQTQFVSQVPTTQYISQAPTQYISQAPTQFVGTQQQVLQSAHLLGGSVPPQYATSPLLSRPSGISVIGAEQERKHRFQGVQNLASSAIQKVKSHLPGQHHNKDNEDTVAYGMTKQASRFEDTQGQSRKQSQRGEWKFWERMKAYIERSYILWFRWYY